MWGRAPAKKHQVPPDHTRARAGHDNSLLFAQMVTEASAFGQGEGDILSLIILEEFPTAQE